MWLSNTVTLCLVLPTALPGQWSARKPLEVHQSGTFQDPRLTESSGVVVSRRHPGTLYSFNDSHNDPVIFVTDTLGAATAEIPVPGARNRDWEAMTVGPCDAGACLYLGDTGDNREKREHVVIYRVPEPERSAAGYRLPGSGKAAPLHVRYPDGPHDVEALIATPHGDLLLITKGRSGGVQEFRIPARAWRSDTGVTAESLGLLPIRPDRLEGRWVTDAALSPDGSTVVVRTYTGLYFFRLGADDRLLPGRPPESCDIAGLEVQGEGVDWLDRHRLVLTSENGLLAGGAIHVITCRF